MTLNLEAFGESSKKKNQTKYKAALGVGSFVSLFGIGSTLAANISLNGGGNVEFGQGVATTAACDEDGFEITPVTSFDNEHSIFRVDYVQVSGIDLTPEGTGWDNVGLSYASQAEAKEAHPGQYYDGTDWKNTCDNVVLDFRAYTDDEQYAKYTLDGYEAWDSQTGFGNSIGVTSPLMWSQKFADDSSDLLITNANNTVVTETPSFAVAFDVHDEPEDNDSYSDNYFAGYQLGDDDYATWIDGNPKLWIKDDTVLDGPQSSFAFKIQSFMDDYRPNASAISKITVQSMEFVPENYWRDVANGPGTPGYNSNGG
jgi:hypothetical protein